MMAPFPSVSNQPQAYMMTRGIVMVVVGVLVGVMSIIGCVGTHRQIQRDRESSSFAKTIALRVVTYLCFGAKCIKVTGGTF